MPFDNNIAWRDNKTVNLVGRQNHNPRQYVCRVKCLSRFAIGSQLRPLASPLVTGNLHMRRDLSLDASYTAKYTSYTSTGPTLHRSLTHSSPLPPSPYACVSPPPSSLLRRTPTCFRWRRPLPVPHPSRDIVFGCKSRPRTRNASPLQVVSWTDCLGKWSPR